MRCFLRLFCIAAFAFSLAGFMSQGEADLSGDHAYWQSLEAGACEDAAYTLTAHSLDARRGLRALRNWEEESWTKGARPLHFPGLEFCLARYHVESGIDIYRSSGSSFPIFENAKEIWSRIRKEGDEESGVDEVYKSLYRFVALSDLYYGPAIAEWARRASDGLLIPINLEEAFESALLADHLGNPVEASLMAGLLTKIDATVQKRIEREVSDEIQGIDEARRDAVAFVHDWMKTQLGTAGVYDHENEGYVAALNAGECEKARALVVAETSDESVEAFFGSPKDPWDQVVPKYDPALFQCRAEAALARGEVLIAGADLMVLAELLYDPALFSLARVYGEGKLLPEDVPRAYQYLVLAEGFGVTDPGLRQSLEGQLSESERVDIDREVKQGWPDLFRNLKETGKAGLFAGPQPGLTLGD